MYRLSIGALSSLALLSLTARAEAAVSILYRYQSVALNAGQTAMVSASCNAGEILVGGGWDATSGKVFTFRSHPNGTPLRWSAAAKNTDSVTQHLYAFAVCASGDANASSFSVAQFVSVNPGSNGWGDPACGSGYVSAGGFFANGTADSNFFPYLSHPMTGSDSHKWRTVFRNSTGSAQSFVAHALCVQNLDAYFDTTAIPGTQVQVSPLQDQPVAYKACSAGYFLTSGGYWTSNNVPNGWLYGSRPDSTTQWLVKTHNGSPYYTMFTQAYAKCIDPW